MMTHLMTSSAVALNGKPFILTMPSPPKRRASAACISLRGTCRIPTNKFVYVCGSSTRTALPGEDIMTTCNGEAVTALVPDGR